MRFLKANTGLTTQLVEEQARALRVSQESDQSKQNPYHGYWNSTFDENATLQLELGRFFERLGKKLARHIGDRSGVPQAFWTGHWMIWWISVKCMDSIHGRCQHMIPECPTWANLPRIYDQAACGVCFSHVTPVKKNNHTGTTLGRRLVIFFRHGGRENYTQAIMHRVFTDFFTLFAPVLIALHALVQP